MIENLADYVHLEKHIEKNVNKIEQIARSELRLEEGSYLGTNMLFQLLKVNPYQIVFSSYNKNNPRLLRISFHTLRHWKATMEYHRTKDILHVMRLLGHKSINSTLLYTQLINFEGDEYTVTRARAAETKKEITALLEAGFEWVGRNSDGLTYFRKRK